MTKFLTTTAIATILAMPAVAEQTDISQTVKALQIALSTIDISDDATDVSQSGINAANIISIDFGSLDDVEQLAEDRMKQISKNDFETEGTFGNNALLTDVSQSGTNVLNSIDLTAELGTSYDLNQLSQKIDDASQKAVNDIDIRNGTSIGIDQDATNVMNMAAMDDMLENAGGADLLQMIDDSSQKASNKFDVDLGVEDIAQDAVNVMNLAEVEDDLKGVSFQMVEDSTQSATNSAFDTEVGASIANLMQSAVNIANSLDVGGSSSNGGSGPEAAIYQVYKGYGSGQLASNFVEFSTGGVTGPANVLNNDYIDQSALNAINLATVSDVGWTISQSARHVDQLAMNNAQGIGSGINADITNFDQSATNVGNILSAGSLPDLSGMTEVSQNFTGFQMAQNGLIGADDLSSVTQAATNVINSVSGL
ncbi:hypothetical protein [Sulfitobacter sp. AS59]|uniref:hypothetical protein n=1 Tax=Sulfitobacter sp. AS59 TaxID=3135784 RepID=UPI00318120DD